MTKGTVNVNGIDLYYEVHGAGAPLVLLHGGVNPSEMFGAPLAQMSKSHRVIAIHMRGHGLSTDGEAPWTYEQMADDVAAFLRKLSIQKADVMGYSMGAGIALQTAIRHPGLVGKVVAISMACKAEGGDYPEIRAAFRAMPANAAVIGKQIASSPLAAMYPNVNWTTMMRKTAEMNLPSHDWTTDVAAIKAPVLLIFADADSITLEHMTSFYRLLGGGQPDAGMDGSARSNNQFAVIPNTTHYNILASPAVAQFATAFLGH